MSDTNTQPAAVVADEAEASGEAEAGSSSTAAPRQESSKSTTSFWSRAARLLRGASPSSLREDLADALMTDADSNAAFSPEERAMLNNILRFREVRVEDVMVPRADIEAVDQSITIGELMVIFEESGRSRMPVYNEGLDDPRGMVHIRDLLAYVTKQARNRRRNGKAQPTVPVGAERMPRQQRAGFDLSRVDLGKTVEEAGIVRQVLFVPPSMLASDLMQRMQAARIQMALVIDEYGGTDGLVSLEDIVEMVVGDIEDEHDDEEVMFARSSDDVFVADARVELEEIAEAIGPDFDVREQLEDVDTLGGLVFASLGRIPVRGEVVQAIPGFEFQILDADPRRVKRVRIMRKRPLARRRVVKTERETPVGRDAEVGAGSQPTPEQ
ncbi:hemolysin family protein [Sinorhizobium terangae]|uniref:CBS domain-containing protein n=1 Tax=Sinorhizobium terangae TaxID=110322 RepID=A0A6N7LC91_SINTE|nr:hemolysin family protein [Sinorhizobium terangae]MBB4183742.1 CBS domain containing-hemolysin-like protein [Sinorhizobium terangae]MQX15226.1 CBS domain-containing protein [Sinorhizobium terangae]WFU47889.1 hemolysin family protein [Sinorhizobium terangae]